MKPLLKTIDWEIVEKTPVIEGHHLLAYKALIRSVNNEVLSVRTNSGEYDIEIQAILVQFLKNGEKPIANSEINPEEFFTITHKVFDHYFKGVSYDKNKLRQLSNLMFKQLSEKY